MPISVNLLLTFLRVPLLKGPHPTRPISNRVETVPQRVKAPSQVMVKVPVEVRDLVVEVKAPMVVLVEVKALGMDKVLVINNALEVSSAFPQTLTCSLSDMSMENLSLKQQSMVVSLNGVASASAQPPLIILVHMLVAEEEGTMEEETILTQEEPMPTLVSFLIPACG